MTKVLMNAIPQPLRFLCVAQHFGFGPMAELVALERALRADPRGARLALALLQNRHLGPLVDGVCGRFELLPPTNGASALETLVGSTAGERNDAVLSSYDSAAVFYGWFIGRPVFFYDGLFWFWKFAPYHGLVAGLLSELHGIRERCDRRGLLELYGRALAVDYHLTVLLAHHLATWSYVRSGRGVTARLAAYPEFASHTQVVGAVIDPTVRAAPAEAGRHVLVSLSGSLAPLLGLEQNIAFARGALAFALEAYEILDVRLPWYFCCHPQIYNQLAAEGRLADLPRGFTALPSFDYRKNLDMIAHAHALFISPGFSSIQEAAYFRVPVFFLPEQNGGQPAQFCMLREAGYEASSNWTVTDVLHHGRPAIGEADVDELYRGIDVIWSDRMRGARCAVLRRFREALRDESKRSQLIKSQQGAAAEVFGDFDGAAVVARHILDIVTR